MHVPFIDLRATHAPLRENILRRIGEVIDESAFAGGKYVAEFEDAFAGYCGARHAIGVGNGTDALWMALLALGIGEGDEVITVPNTFIATAEAISFTGAKPVFVDVCRKTYTMDPALLEQAITSRTRAVVPVHLYGQTAEMDPILAIARRHGLKVIEDACQAHGAKYKGRVAGTIGDAGCFSFYPGKNLGAIGEGGAIITNDDALAQQMRVFRDHGQASKYNHACIGWNARMDGIQGAVLNLKLLNLDPDNSARRALAAHYDACLSPVDEVETPFAHADGTHVYHIYAVRVPSRDEVLKKLQERGVTCGIHYPTPVHLQRAYQSLNIPAGSFPVTEESAKTLLSLPMYPTLTYEAVEYVVKELVGALRDLRSVDALVA
jgi:dTDP-4-amino-4,6-dideoxygalactose transaminase